MKLSDILVKMAEGKTLSATELQELKLKANQIDQAESLVTGWVQPGTTIPFIRNLRAENIKIPSGEITLGENSPGNNFNGVRIAFPAMVYNGESWNLVGIDNDVLQVGIRASDGKFVAAGGNVEIDGSGIIIFEGDVGQSWLSFYNASDQESIAFKFADDNLQVQSRLQGGTLHLCLIMTNNDTPHLVWEENPSVANQTHLAVNRGAAGALVDLGKVKLSGEGTSGSSYVELTTTSNSTITDANKSRMYMVGNKLVFQLLDGATTRYKYLDLAGTGVTWVHTTTAPTP